MANVKLKLQATRTLTSRLNPARRAYWGRIIDGLEARARAKVSGETDWDLALANELDRIYTAVAEEATKTRKEAFDALSDAEEKVVKPIDDMLWPLAIIAVAYVAFSWGKR